jgi:hypothetical protein
MPRVILDGEGSWWGRLPGMNAGGNPKGKVDWDGQHCRFCRFLILSRVSSSLIPDFKGSSGPDACARVAKAARNGNEVARPAAKTARVASLTLSRATRGWEGPCGGASWRVAKGMLGGQGDRYVVVKMLPSM